MTGRSHLRPATLAEAIEALADADRRPAALAGGTDLVLKMHGGLIGVGLLVDLSLLDELRGISIDEGRISVGAMTTMAALAANPDLRRVAPVLAEAAGWVGSAQIRTMATLGGNVVNASPVADTVPALHVLDAVARLAGPGSERIVRVADLAVGPGKTVLGPGEIVTRIEFAPLEADERTFYARTAQRSQLSIAKTTLALRLTLRDGVASGVRVAMGAVAPRVIPGPRTCDFLEGRALDDEAIEEAARLLSDETRPITDHRSTREYRAGVTGRLLARGLRHVLGS